MQFGSVPLIKRRVQASRREPSRAKKASSGSLAVTSTLFSTPLQSLVATRLHLPFSRRKCVSQSACSRLVGYKISRNTTLDIDPTEYITPVNSVSTFLLNA